MDRYAKYRRKWNKTGARASVCSLCNIGGFTEFCLRQHLRKEHNYKICKHCNGIFDGESSLREHLCPLKNIPCDQCPKFFRTAAGWMLHHRKVHRGIRPVCDICGDLLSNGNNLRRHMETQHPQVVSDGESPVPPCPICGKQLKNKACLYSHERRVHSGKCRSDPCKFCNRVFYTGFSLRRHLATVHRGEFEKQQETVMEDKTAKEEDEIRDMNEEEVDARQRKKTGWLSVK